MAVDVFKTKKKCRHGYAKNKRVNDIELLGKHYRQMRCDICGCYKYEINLADYHPLLKFEIINVNAPFQFGDHSHSTIT